ncbi:MAG: N-6 DNA methylase [Candidatus Lokiarchaeota archaeon]|nr:N-6 DNA methylase [Candidatus Lokiarchaeota archaeon]
MLKNEAKIKEEFLVSFVETPPDISKLMVKLISKPKNARILDTGCGKGVFLNSLLMNGYKNLEGIELNKKIFESCKSSFKNVVIYNDDYLMWDTSKKYDVIIGNPPYSHYNSLPNEIQKEVLDITNTAESDIYYAFIIKSIDLLNEKGELIYIIPYQFMYNTHAEGVRKKIVENGYIDMIIDLDEVRLFEGEQPETIIFKFVKTENRSYKNIEVFRIKHRKARPENIFKKLIESLNEKKENGLFFYYTKLNFSNYREIWSSYPSIDIPEYKKLKDMAFVGVGLVSGFDKAFRIKDDEDAHYNEKEKKLIYNFIKAVNCKGFRVEGYEKYILMDEKIKEELYLSKNYPNIYKKLIEFKEQMSTRYMPNHKKWFHWQALRNKMTLDKYMELPKIFVPTLDRSKVNRFSFSDMKAYPSGDVLVIIPFKIDPYFLLGYLNSAFFRQYYLSHGAKRGYRIAFTQRIMSNIKIPVFENEELKNIANLTREILNNNDFNKRKSIDDIINNALEKMKQLDKSK